MATHTATASWKRVGPAWVFQKSLAKLIIWDELKAKILMDVIGTPIVAIAQTDSAERWDVFPAISL